MDSVIEIDVQPHGRWGTELSIVLGADHAEDLRGILVQVHEERKELRWHISEDWIIFWKIKTGAGKCLLAHPENDRWVGTVAVSEESLGQVLSLVKEGKSVVLDEVAQLSSPSNLNIRITLRK